MMWSDNATSIPTPNEVTTPTVGEEVALGLYIALIFLLECAIFEAFSWEAVRELWRQKGGVSLYVQAIASVLFNMLVITPAIVVASRPFMSDVLHSPAVRFSHVVIGVIVHSIGYYFTHRAMHTPALYWCHRFHHRFNKHICPVAANAVTPVEFVIAYACPFVLGAYLFSPDRQTARLLTHVIGFCNLCIHTPKLEGIAAKHCPVWLVGTHDHFAHHRRLVMNYGA